MGVFKRGRNYWYEFEFRGQRVRESAHTPNRELARSIERFGRNSPYSTIAIIIAMLVGGETT
jgi:hypothetical protein